MWVRTVWVHLRVFFPPNKYTIGPPYLQVSHSWIQLTVDQKHYFRSVVGSPWIWTADCRLFYVILYKGLEHLWVLLSVGGGVLEPIPHGHQGTTWVFGGIKSYMWIFNCMGVSAPNPSHIVPVSTVHANPKRFICSFPNHKKMTVTIHLTRWWVIMPERGFTEFLWPSILFYSG